VGLGRVGIVLGLEVSRLARKSSDWARLLEICALTNTLLLDEDGLYDPANFNDRLLLGLKGTMSEAELHFLKARMRGGLLNKARRGDLRTRLPTGLVYTPDERVVLDPDQQVQQAFRCLFATFRRTGSALATVRAFHDQGLSFPSRIWAGPHKGQLRWGPLTHARALSVLRNPRYAGAFVFGRHRCRRMPGGHKREALPRDEWTAFFPGAHPGYISWQQYEENLRRLEANRIVPLEHQRSTPPREGTALLQGLVVCGRCGRRMSVHYCKQKRRTYSRYVCRQGIYTQGRTSCQSIAGADVDAAVGALVVEAFAPLALEVALGVQQDLEARAAEVDGLRRQQLERLRYHAELAQRRYMSVDPENRLVAAQLETEWNEALAALETAEEEYEIQRKRDQVVINEEQRARILALATDFPRLWNDPRTQPRDRKRLLHLLVEDVTLIRGEEITVHVRFKGGAIRTLTLPLPLPSWKRHRTSTAVIEEIDRLLEEHTEAQAAQILNDRGFRSGHQHPFDANMVHCIAQKYNLKTRYQRLRQRGLLTAPEIAAQCGVHRETVTAWYHQGRLKGYLCDARNRRLFEPPGPQLLQRNAANQPRKQQESDMRKLTPGGAV
jgi:DNA invertase Pin-like site-specific DNA recombinase/DNA-binding transcriptional regulator YiaG